MVTKKKLDYGFSGYRVPIIPRAPRSIRSSQRRGPCKNLAEESKLCAFELLADVAGKLLLGSESSASSNVAEGKVQLGICRGGEPMDDKALKPESFNHGSCAESAFVPDISIPEHSLLSSFKGPRLENDSVLEHTSVLASSDVHKKLDCDINIGTCEGNNADRITTPKVGVSIYVCDSSKTEVGSGPVMHSKDDKNEMDNITMSNVYIVKDPIEECVNSNMLINSDSSVQLPLYRDSSRDALLQKCWNNVKLGIRDDDDNSYGCVKSSTASRPYRPHPRIGQRRIRKMLTSKYRKVAPKLKGRELYNNTRNGVMTYYQYRKRIYTRERCQQEPIKRRKLSNKIFAVAYNQETSSDSISNLHDKGMRIDKSSSTVILERGSDSLGTMKAHKKTTDPHVKFSIKSVKVPELYLEIPETATVGSLKRTVMEAVTAIFESGLRVGIVLQGKKVRDDNRTLQQAGISQSSNLDTLGFTLEPSLTDASQPMTTKKFPSILPCGTDQKLPRSPATPVTDSGISNATVGPPFVSKSDDDSNNNEFLSSPQTPINELMDGAVPNSKTLVPVLPMNVDAMAVVQVNPKSKRNELSHRRTRRPFSVAEVEGLVEAVETLGTGRWRDVKIGAFENADHRTYVDLKDKWKTLVHTATISPQQRRGEPVPQELLDRVLSAHSYWSQYQSKQQGKHLVETVDPQNESVEV